MRRRLDDQPAAAAAAAAPDSALAASPPLLLPTAAGGSHAMAVGLRAGGNLGQGTHLLAFGWDCRRQCGVGRDGNTSDAPVECVRAAESCRLLSLLGLLFSVRCSFSPCNAHLALTVCVWTDGWRARCQGGAAEVRALPETHPCGRFAGPSRGHLSRGRRLSQRCRHLRWSALGVGPSGLRRSWDWPEGSEYGGGSPAPRGSV